MKVTRPSMNRVDTGGGVQTYDGVFFGNKFVPSQMSRTIEPSARRSVLLVDHDPDTRELYAHYLKAVAYDIDEAEDGRVALAKILSRHYDTLVTDTRVSGMNGYELAHLVRCDSNNGETAIVVVTSESQPADIERAYRAGADVVLIKPCLPETLLSALQHALETTGSPAAPRPPQASDTNRRFSLSRAHQRGETTTPPIGPPSLVCPVCDRLLISRRSHIGGVSARHSEQWDYYECPAGCGTFQYRQRTRSLRRA